MLIGITGQIGSGKSTAAKFFKSIGAAVIDADKIGKDVVENSKALLKDLVKTFGSEILNKNKKLNRRKLAQVAFSSSKNTKLLNDLVHPYLLNELDKQINKNCKSHSLVVIDAALLFNWKLEKQCDYAIMIHTSESTRFARLVKRKISKSDAKARQKAQFSYSKMKSKADICILNNSSESALQIKLLDWFDKNC